MERTLATWTVVLGVLWALPGAAQELGAIRFRHAGTGEHGVSGQEARFLASQGCHVGPLSGARLRLFSEALELARAALADPTFSQVVGDKRDWRVGGATGWSIDPEAGGRLLERIGSSAENTVVAVLGYGRDATHRCATPLGDEGIHAYARLGEGVLVFREDYLDALVGAEDGPRRLAATLFHELVHALGGEHPNAIEDIGGVVYQNTVPVYLGCVVRAWPDADGARERCSGSLAKTAGPGAPPPGVPDATGADRRAERTATGSE